MFIQQPGNRKIIGTVGQLQFEVILYRLEHEYGAKCTFRPRSFHLATWITSDDQSKIDAFKRAKTSNVATDTDGNLVFLAETPFLLQIAERDYPEITFHRTSEFLLEKKK
jgi:peptide chain release factor 3